VAKPVAQPVAVPVRLNQHLPRLLLALLSAASQLCSQAVPGTAPANPQNETSSYEGRKIVEIRFSPAMPPAEADELRQSIPLKPGLPFDSLTLRESLRILFRTGRFHNLQVDAEKRDQDVVLTFLTEPEWFIGSVEVDGVPSAMSRGEMINAAKLQLGATYSESAANQGVEGMENSLRLNGYYESRVSYLLERDPQHQQVNIHFVVVAQQRAHFSEPQLRGSLVLPEAKLVRAANWQKFRGLFGTKPPLGGWYEFSDQKVRSGVRGIQQLYRKNDYLMSKTQIERVDYQPDKHLAIPSLRLDAGPKISILATGVKMAQKDLRRLVPVYEEQSVDRELRLEGAAKIAAFFRAKGFFDAKVVQRIEQQGQETEDIDPKANAAIIYTIDRGPQYRVTDIFLRGNNYFGPETLLERMAVKPATRLRYRQGRFSDELLAGDRAAIEELYRSNGFLEVKVESGVVRDYKGRAQQVAVTIDIAEGPQSKVGQVSIDGVSEDDRHYLEGYVSALPGQPFSTVNINNDREKILGLLYENGYSEAAFESTSRPGTQPATVDITYKISAGPQHFVRDIVVSGLGATQSSLVNKRIRLSPGAPLNNAEIYASQRRLYDLGIFARVDTALQNPEGNEISKTVLFNLEEASRWSFNGGLGAEIARIGGSITSFNSPAGGTGFSPRLSLGVNRTNFWGLGHTIGAQTRISNIQRRFLLTYLAPQFRDSDRFSLTATTLYDDARNVRTFNSKRLEASLQLAQRIDLANSMQYRFTFRRVTIDQDTIKIDPALVPLLALPVRVGSFSSTYIQDRRDDPVDAKRGRYTTLDFGVASKLFAASTNFTRLLGRNSTYYKIGRDMVFARSLTFGVLTPYLVQGGLSSAQDVPLPERFYGGGAYSHRGFPENQAGPRDLKTGFPVGGKALLVNNLELRFPLVGDNLGGVFFHDAGNVYTDLKKVSLRWNQRSLSDFDYMVHAFGFGIRYRTPIGPVRVDLAFTPNSPGFNGFEGSREDLLFGRGVTNRLRVNRFQFHISLGQAF
jgi:outer membrane protein insertion porin family